jgi:hypothetical protein
MYGSQGVFCATVYFAYVYIWISYVKIVNVSISGVYSGPQSTYRGRVEIGGYWIFPLSWSVHHIFERDGKYSERGWAWTPHPHWAGLIFPA